MSGFSLLCEQTAALLFPTSISNPHPLLSAILLGFFAWSSPLLPWKNNSHIPDQIHCGPDWPIIFWPIIFSFFKSLSLKEQQNPLVLLQWVCILFCSPPSHSHPCFSSGPVTP